VSVRTQTSGIRAIQYLRLIVCRALACSSAAECGLWLEILIRSPFHESCTAPPSLLSYCGCAWSCPYRCGSSRRACRLPRQTIPAWRRRFRSCERFSAKYISGREWMLGSGSASRYFRVGENEMSCPAQESRRPLSSLVRNRYPVIAPVAASVLQA